MKTLGAYARAAALLVALGSIVAAAAVHATDLRRENEGRALDLKMWQQQRLREQPEGSARRQLENTFERQQTQQRELQRRQRQQLPAGPEVYDQPWDSQRQRFSREQQGQILDFKMQTLPPPFKPVEPGSIDVPERFPDRFDER